MPTYMQQVLELFSLLIGLSLGVYSISMVEKLKLPSAKMGASALTHAAYKNWVTCLLKDCVDIATVFARDRRG